MLPILQVGPLAIQFPGLILLAGIWIGSSIAERWAERNQISPGLLTNLIFYSLIAGVLGARLGYALRFLTIYLEEPLGLLSLNPSTLSLPEGALVALIAAVAYGQRRDLPLWPTLDSLAPGQAAFAVFLGGAHLASGDAFGAPTSVPWAIPLWGAMRHPTQAYEMVLGIVVLWIVLKLPQEGRFPGMAFLSFLTLSGASHLILSGFRGDSVLVLGSLRQGQVLAWLVMLLGLLGLHLRARRHFARIDLPGDVR